MPDNRKAALRKQGQSRLVESYEQFFQYGPAAFGTDDLARVEPEMMKPVIAGYFNSV